MKQQLCWLQELVQTFISTGGNLGALQTAGKISGGSGWGAVVTCKSKGYHTRRTLQRKLRSSCQAILLPPAARILRSLPSSV